MIAASLLTIKAALPRVYSQLLPVLVAAPLFIVAISSCGSSSTEDPSLTRAQFIKRAGAICQEAEAEVLEKAVAYKKSHPAAEEEAMVKPVLLPPLEKQIQGIKSLNAPSGDEAVISAMTSGFEAALLKAKADPKTLFAAKTNPFKEADLLARRYGLTQCSNAP